MSLSLIVLFAVLLLAANLVVLVRCDSDDTLSQGEMRSVQLFESHSAALQSASNRFHNLADSSASVAASLVVLVPALTVGPYFTEVSDFVYSRDLLAAGKAGASGVTTDRLSVLDGAPLSLTLNIYNVSGSIAYPIEGATVFIWHCDGYGVYSAVSSASGNPENTLGQKWLRGYQTTTSTGTVTFNTIIPGWYTGRTVHQHIRVHLPTASNDTYVITTQLFPSTAVINAVSSIYPYSSDTQSYTALTADSIYSSVSSTLASEIILNTTGTTSGYSSVFNLGIDLSTAASTTTSSPGGGGSQTNGASTTGTTSSSASLLKLFTNAHLFIPALVSITVVFLYQM